MFQSSNIKILCVLVLFATLSACTTTGTDVTIRREEQTVIKWLQDLEDETVAEQANIAAAAYADPNTPASIRARALYLLASRPSAELQMAQKELSALYEKASPATKMNMEHILFADLYTADTVTLGYICQNIPPVQARIFPYSMSLYVGAERGVLQNNEKIKKAFSESSPFLYPVFTGRSFYDKEKDESATKSASIALLLPLSGNLASVGNQVKIGAQIAQLYLLTENYDLEIYYIDTQDPNWLEQLNQLPEETVTVGGPLEIDKFNMLYETSFTIEHTVFGFLPILPPQVHEGQDAWRFFTSPTDQIKTMLDVIEGDFNITNYGVLAPDDAYGRHMAELFSEQATARDFDVITEYYPAKNTSTWSRIIAKFLVSKPSRKSSELPTVNTPAEAIFLPDVWRNSELLISTLNYHGGQKKIILGSSLWEQGNSTILTSDAQIYALTIYPAALNLLQGTPEVEIFLKGMNYMQTIPSDWAVLGFDFALMAAEIGLDKQVSSEYLNTALSDLYIPYAGAPITWDLNGMASRQLFVQQPTYKGKMPYHEEIFKRVWINTPQLVNENYNSISEKNSTREAVEELDSLIDTILGTEPETE